jgi:hypothetical protein
MNFADHYGSVAEATDYFANRLHEFAWTNAPPLDRQKSLIMATRIIDTLNFKGNKATVTTLISANCADGICDSWDAISDGCVTRQQIQDASLAQNLEFPRGNDTVVPDTIMCACFEIAHSLLDGKDPEIELENLGIISQGYASVRTTYSRTQVPIDHIINFVPNALAWRWIRPFLRDEDAIILTRKS